MSVKFRPELCLRCQKANSANTQCTRPNGTKVLIDRSSTSDKCKEFKERTPKQMEKARLDRRRAFKAKRKKAGKKKKKR